MKKIIKIFLCLLVRMRSQYHTLKDMETGTAPTRHFLTPVRATQPKRKKQEAASGPLFFHVPQRTAPRPCPSSPVLCPAGHPSASNPHGANVPGLASPSAGDCDGADKTSDPALCQAADNRPRLARGGPPVSRNKSSVTFKTLKIAKKGLQSGWIECKMFPRKTEYAAGWKGCPPPSPARVSYPPTQQRYSAPTPIVPCRERFGKWKRACVADISCCAGVSLPA